MENKEYNALQWAKEQMKHSILPFESNLWYNQLDYYRDFKLAELEGREMPDDPEVYYQHHFQNKEERMYTLEEMKKAFEAGTNWKELYYQDKYMSSEYGNTKFPDFDLFLKTL